MSTAVEILPNIKELYQWEERLYATERTILEVAYKLYVAQQIPGTCYNASFFLCYYLKKHFDIDGRVEVGFVNNGLNDEYASHAWYVHKGRITDLCISRTLNAAYHHQGPLTILGRTIIEGWNWNYYTANSKEGLAALTKLLTSAAGNPNDPAFHAKNIHIRMANVAKSKPAMRAYLDRCPHGMTYRDLVEAIRHVPIESIHEDMPDNALGFKPSNAHALLNRY